MTRKAYERRGYKMPVDVAFLARLAPASPVRRRGAHERVECYRCHETIAWKAMNPATHTCRVESACDKRIRAQRAPDLEWVPR